MRVRPVSIVLLLTLLAGLSGFNRALASPFLSATNISWQEYYGSPTNLPAAGVTITNVTLCLLVHGDVHVDTTNILSTVTNWLTDHPQAVVVPVCESQAAGSVSPGSKQLYAWVVQDEDVLNVELVRQGCVGPTTQILTKGDHPKISRADYNRFVQQIVDAGKEAEATRAGIWARVR